MVHNPIICALDTTHLPQAQGWCVQLAGHVGAVKLGLEFFVANGPEGVRTIQQTGVPVFLDLKLHDIPNTVAGAVRAAVALNVWMITVHTLGGADMLKAAVQAAKEEADKLGVPAPMVIGVTILTSMNQQDINAIGLQKDLEHQVLHLAELAHKAGVDGCVCSPLEINLIKSRVSPHLKLVVPGIRPMTATLDDQKRTMPPARAMEEGADYLVIGRPITNAPDITLAAQQVLKEIRRA